eukprot:TRINITY_DN22454_c1_g4_i1.p1 TRINITY_DN22454_c1_g4~~TRINITY_DN22454_c1_g4_i1.p1  ORF type:complete len:653 (+),score=101.20 TRINITY_DN22454_c1_g4_i1:50-1960(+)
MAFSGMRRANSNLALGGNIMPTVHHVEPRRAKANPLEVDKTQPPGSVPSSDGDVLRNIHACIERQLSVAQQELHVRHRSIMQDLARLCANPGNLEHVSAKPAGEGPAKGVVTNAFQVDEKFRISEESALIKSPSSKGATVPSSKDGVGGKRNSRPVLGSQAAWDKDAESPGETMPLSQDARRTIKEAFNEKGPVNRGMFADPETLKAQVKASLLKEEYNVMELYSESGIWQAIAKNNFFDYCTLAIIALNSIWIAVDVDYNTAPSLFAAEPPFIVIENLFCFYFAFEILVRFLAFADKRSCIKDLWFVFDMSLVVTMVFETWIMNTIIYAMGYDSSGEVDYGDTSLLRLVRLLRLTRMARLVRLLRSLPELVILAKGISVAARSVFFTLFLLMSLVYVFAVGFVQVTKGTPLGEKLFKTVAGAMSTLLFRATLPDVADLVETVAASHFVFAAFLSFFILLASLTVLNMLVGVLCEVINVVSAVERERMTVKFVKTKLMMLLQKSDKNENHLICRQEFEALLRLPEGAKIIQEVGVDAVGLIDFADQIFEGGVEITFPEFMEFVLQLRGTNITTVRDIVDLRKTLASAFQATADQVVERVHASIDAKIQSSFPSTHVAQVARVQAAGQNSVIETDIT